MKTLSNTIQCGIFLLTISVILTACGKGVQFNHAQPEDLPPLLAIPVEFQGKWRDANSLRDCYFVTREEILHLEQEEEAYPLDSLLDAGDNLKGDSLFFRERRSLKEIMVENEGYWKMLDTLPSQKGKTSLLEGGRLVAMQGEHYYQFTGLKSTGHFAAYDTSGKYVPHQSVEPGEYYELYWSEKKFFASIGDTVIKEVSSDHNMNYIHLESGPQEFLHHDSTSYLLKNDLLHVRHWVYSPFLAINETMVFKADGSYGYINFPTSLIGGWYLFVLEKIGPDQLRLIGVGSKEEVIKYFPVVEDSVNALGDTLYDYYASPKPEDLRLFLQDDSLDWDTLVRIP
jgi:hypothetical protein